MRVWVLLVVFVGCRIGFDLHEPIEDDQILDPAQLEIRVLADAYADEPAGTPIAGATVLVDRGAGIVERVQTDADGSARVASAGVAYVHAVHHSDLGWRVYTVAAPAGVVELGGRPGPTADHQLSINLPDDGSTDYAFDIPTRCGFRAQATSAKIQLSYYAACEGQTVRGLAVENRGPAPSYLELPALPLIANSTVTATGAFQREPTASVALFNKGGTTYRVGAQLLSRNGIDLLPRSETFEVLLNDGAGAAALAQPFAPTVNFLSGVITCTGAAADYLSRTELLRPQLVNGDTSVNFTAIDFLVPWQQLELTPPSLAWAAQAGGTILVVETGSDLVQWSAYLAPSATAAPWPALPADLGVPTPASFNYAQVSKLEVPGATREDLLRTIDRRWQLWPADELLLPAAGGSISTVLYAGALSAR